MTTAPAQQHHPAKDHDVVAIGHAIVDILVRIDPALLQELGLAKGTMSLVNAQQAEALYDRLGAGVETSGGSAANTIAGLASLGSCTGFIGRVRDDQLGRIFSHDIKALGITYDLLPIPDGPPTARCLVLITPDADRTMCTDIGCSRLLNAGDVDMALVQRSKVLYLEGYLFDDTHAKDAFRQAAAAARVAGTQVALSLSDAFCVQRHHSDFLAMVNSHVDILFANEAEIKALLEVESCEEAVLQLQDRRIVAAVTRAAQGSVVLQGQARHNIQALQLGEVVDSTGAGDLYAAGFLHGYTRQLPLVDCGRIGSLAAAEVIGHIGPRPHTSLQTLLQQQQPHLAV